VSFLARFRRIIAVNHETQEEVAAQPLHACWRWAAARVRGELHERLNQPLQDAYAFAHRPEALFMAVADGAGSTSNGGRGAILLTRHLRQRFRETPAEELGDAALRQWILEADERMHALARRRECAVWDFSTTLLAVIATDDAFHVAQVGDSSIAVAGADGEWDLLCWPKNGEYSNVTFFVPLRTLEDMHLYTFRNTQACTSLALFTDGIADLGVSDAGVANGFFNYWLAPLLQRSQCGHHHDISLAMRQRLREHPAIRERTEGVGDDRTLIIATRGAPCPPATT